MFTHIPDSSVTPDVPVVTNLPASITNLLVPEMPALHTRLLNTEPFAGLLKAQVEAPRFAGTDARCLEVAEIMPGEFQPGERANLQIALLASDIGKAGTIKPEGAVINPLIMSMYEEQLPQPEAVTVDAYLATNFDRFTSRLGIDPATGEKYTYGNAVATLKQSLGLTESSTMRDFYNTHTELSLEAFDAAVQNMQLPEADAQRMADIRNAVALHHAYRGMDTNAKFGGLEAKTMAIDLYDALRVRSGLSHEDAVHAIVVKFSELKLLPGISEDQVANIEAQMESMVGSLNMIEPNLEDMYRSLSAPRQQTQLVTELTEGYQAARARSLADFVGEVQTGEPEKNQVPEPIA